MSGVIDTLEREQLRKGIPSFDAGDRVKVHFQVVEGTRRRTQVFEGIVLKRQGSGARETFTVRKQSFGVGVERTFPVHSPKIERIEVAARGDVRRAKLYYLRGRVGRRARVRERQYTGAEAARAAAPEGPFDELGAQEEAPPETIVPEGAEGGPPAEEIPSDAEAKATADAGEAGQGGDEPRGESAAEPEGDEPSAEEPSAEEPSAEDGGQQPEAADEGAPEDRDADQSGS